MGEEKKLHEKKRMGGRGQNEDEEDIIIIEIENINRELSPYQKHRLVEETKENG